MTVAPARYDRSTNSVPSLGPLPRRNLPMLTQRVFPILRKLIDLGYFSLSVEGAQHVPRSGPAIYVGNHAGWFTLDTLMGAVAVAEHVGVDRLPWGAVQDQLLKAPHLGAFFEGVGGFPASWLRTPEAIPPEMEVFCVYPEGVEGNCKSLLDAYQMRPWRTGFIRMAVARGAPVVPVSIIGGEECLPAASSIRLLKPLLGTILPLPLAPVPLPAHWRFIFHEPVFISRSDLGWNEDPETQRSRARVIAESIRARVQQTLDRETSGHVLVRLSKMVRNGSQPHASDGADEAAAYPAIPKPPRIPREAQETFHRTLP